MPNKSKPIKTYAIALILSIIGSIVGYFACLYLAKSGFYSLVFVGVGAGLLGGILLKEKNYKIGLMCGLISIFGSLLTESLLFPFKADHSFQYFISNVHKLKTITLIMIAVGAFIAFRMGMGVRAKKTNADQTEPQA